MELPVAAVAVREVPAPPSWEALRQGLARAPGAWLLESTLPSPRLGRFSFAGARPYAWLRGVGTRLHLEPLRPVRPDLPARPTTWPGDPFQALAALRPAAVEAGPAAAALPFVGGAVGWLGYELAARIERVDFPGLDDLGLPDLAWALVDRVLVREMQSGRLWACALGFGMDARGARPIAERAAEALAEDVARGRPERLGLGCEPEAPPRPREGRRPARSAAPLRLRDAPTGLVLGAFFDAEGYAKAVHHLLERIEAGDVYQANLTHRLEAAFEGDPWRLYENLARRNPAPFAAYLVLPELTLVGSSPERFLHLQPDGRVESRPIKGTRPRGASSAEDAVLRRALAASGKDQAENLMIVDLVRNDLGRVCEIGSVAVPELMEVEEYATVFQLVSTVTGRLRRDRDVADLLRAAFPPGSMTGAPKIAAMQILSRLEPVRRGVYAGALGWLDARGSADLCVVIRTALVRDEVAYLHVGGAVVADSDPLGEWQESLDKARALLDALAVTRG